MLDVGVDVEMHSTFISRRWLGSCAPLTISNLSLKGQKNKQNENSKWAF